ncbi:MAG TPA: efflux RND transporter periplasmic adaptor subunit, partial [Thermoanaerobaculia bacterium]|nr:efflux RND transporter periplasmic adaptor subunit [Thermoanaerobaculia bacterium]
LAADRVEGLDARARRLAESLAAAEQGLPEGSPHAPFVVEARRAAEGLAATGELPPARRAFGEVSRFLMPVAAADERLVEGRYAYSCPMTGSTFGKWFGGEEMENPYMGQEMLQCGTAADWTVSGVDSVEELEGHVEHVHGVEPTDPEAVAFHTCPMHPSVRAHEPGACPICGMDLEPVTAGEVASGVVFVDERRRQAIGVRTAPVVRAAMGGSVEAVGKVVFDETRLTDVSVKYRGWIGQLHVDESGQAVRRGQPLFTLYSPELYAAQQDFLTALGSQRAARGTAAPERADYLVRAARERLRLWDLAPAQIDRLAATGEAVERIPILSPASGFVVEKNVVEGAAVEPGQKLFRIAGLDRVWVEAEVYESELPRVAVGQPAVVTFPYLPGKEFRGKVGFVYPYLDGASRTGRVRVELANPEGALKPDMYASVAIATTGGERLAVPESAVLHAGKRDFVFVDLGDGRLRPQRVETGMDDGEHVEIVSGLEIGDVVVTSGNFLVAAESRLRLALDRWQ